MSLLEHLHVKLTLVYPETYHPDIDEIRIHLFQNLGVDVSPFTPESEHIAIPEKLKNGFLTQTLAFVLVPQRTGSHTLTFFGIPFDPNLPNKGPRVLLMSGIVTVKVNFPSESLEFTNPEPSLMALSPLFPVDLSPTNKAQFYFTAEKKAQETKRNLRVFKKKTIPWLALGILMLAICFAILFIKSKETISNPFVVKQVSPKSKALKELKKIKLLKDSYLNTYQKLAAILNQFIEEKYNIQIRAKSSEELMAQITLLPFEPKMQTALKEFIARADQIKFGLFEISSEQSQKDVRIIQDFINNS